MLVLALSDLHGKDFQSVSDLIDRSKPDWIVLCGDILPDFNMISGRISRLEAQRSFWSTYRSTFLRAGVVTTFVRGNHEIEGFSDPYLNGVPEAFTGQVALLEGVPAEFGTWGWSREWEQEELEKELEDQLGQTREPRIFLSHVPPYGCLDRSANGSHIGHRPLFHHLRAMDWPPVLVLCGHVHESFGNMLFGETLVVNVACGHALLEIGPDGVEVLSQDRMVCVEPEPW